jgi:hypothetical protein
MRRAIRSLPLLLLLAAALYSQAQTPEQRQAQRKAARQAARQAARRTAREQASQGDNAAQPPQQGTERPAGRGGACRPAVRLAGPEELVFSYQRQSCDKKENFTDNRPSAFVDAGGEVNMLISNGDATYRMVGRDLSNLKMDCSEPVMRHNPESSNAGPQALWNDTYMHSPYTLDGKIVHMLIHNEYHGEMTKDPQQNCGCTGKACEERKTHCWYPTTSAAVSSTGGKHFHPVEEDGRAQPAIASWYQYKAPGRPPFPRLQGIWYQTNIVGHKDDDGKTRFYVIISTALNDESRPGHCIFRNDNIGNVHGWRGWDGNGYNVNMSFNPYGQVPEEATRTRCKRIDADLGSFTFNQVLGQYLGTAGTKMGANGATVVSFSASPDLLQWDDAGSVVLQMNHGDGGKYAKNRAGKPFEVMYTTILDPKSEGRNFENSGARPYLYYVRPAFVPKGHMGWQNRDLFRIPLEVTCQ